MAEINLELLFDDSGAIGGLDRMENLLNDIADASQKSQKELNDAFKQVKKPIEDIEKGIAKNTNTFKKNAKAISDSKKKHGELSKSLKDLVGNVSFLGVSINDLTESFNKYTGILKNSFSALINFGKLTDRQKKSIDSLGTGFGSGRKTAILFARSMNILRAAIISTGIGALVIALGSLIAFLTRTQEGTNALSRFMSRLGATVDVIIDRAAEFGKVIFDALSDPKQAVLDLVNIIKTNLINRLKAIIDLGGAIGLALKGAFTLDIDAIEKSAEKAKTALLQVTTGLDEEQQRKTANFIKGVAEEIERESDAADKLTASLQKLEKAEIAQIVRSARLKKEIKEQNKIAEDTTKTYEEREEAARTAFETSEKLLTQELNLLKRRASILAQQQALGNSSLEDERELAELRASIFEREEGVLELQTTLNNKLNIIRDERNRKIDEENKRVSALKDAYLEAADSIRKTLEEQQVESLDGEERINKEREIALAELKILEDTAKAKSKLAGEEFTLQSEFAELRKLVNQEADKEITNFRAEEVKRRKALEDKEFAAENDKIKKLSEVELARIDLLKESADRTLSLEEFKEKRRLEIQKQAAIEQLELLKTRFGHESPEAQLLEAQIQQIENSIGEIGKEGEKLTDNFLKNFGLKFFEAIGLDDEEAKKAVAAVATVFSSLNESFASITQSQIQQQENTISALDERINETKEALDRELELKKAGFANNFDVEKENLEKQQAEREAAEEKANALREKAAKQKQRIDTINQVNSLITSSANIIEGFSKIPIVGIALGIAAVATMLGFFIKSKAEAAKAAKAPKLRQGGAVSDYFDGHLQGASHEGGGIPAIAGGRQALELEGGEYVVNRKDAAIQRGFLDRINSGEFGKVNLEEVVDGIANSPMRQKIENVGKLQSDIRRMEFERKDEILIQTIEKGLEKQTQSLLEGLEAREIVIPDGKHTIKKKVGNTTIIKKIDG